MAAPQNVGIIGNGNVGSALGEGLRRARHKVTAVGNNPAQVRQVGKEAQVLILAVPHNARKDALRELGDGAKGKT